MQIENVVAIIQARMGSTRCPEKIMRFINKKTLLECIIERVQYSKVDTIVVATTENESDNIVERLCEKRNIACFRGSEEDVLSRFYLAAKKYKADIIVRITADDPFKDPQIINLIIDTILVGKYDYVSNTIKPTYPDGLDVEAFTFSALKRAYTEAQLASEREHVTPFIWKNPDMFCCYNVTYKKDLSDMRWTLDTEDDYEFAVSVYKYFKDQEIFYMDDILKVLKEHPELAMINQGHIKNEGYMKSIREESKMNKGVIDRICDLEKQYVNEVLATDFRSSKGSIMMQRLEQSFADYSGRKYAISFINGTQNMHAALVAKGIGEGDEVIVPPLTMASTTFAVLQAGATPIFADVCEDSFLIDLKSIESNISNRTKAIIPVSLYGLVPQMDKIMEIAEKYNLFVLEDDAECFGGTYKGKKVGTFGHAASFSFQSSKHLTAGEGGMIITDDLELAQNIRRVGSLGYAGVSANKGKITKTDIQDPDYCRHVSMGWNYRMPELCAAVALAQVERAEELIEVRTNVGKRMLEVVGDCSWLHPQHMEEEGINTYWTVAMRLDTEIVSWHEFRDKYLEYGGDGIYAAWKLTYQEPMFQNMQLNGMEHKLTRGKEYYLQQSICPIAERIQPQILQFKTNYWDETVLKQQLDVLKKTIAWFENK